MTKVGNTTINLFFRKAHINPQGEVIWARAGHMWAINDFVEEISNSGS